MPRTPCSSAVLLAGRSGFAAKHSLKVQDFRMRHIKGNNTPLRSGSSEVLEFLQPCHIALNLPTACEVDVIVTPVTVSEFADEHEVPRRE